MRIELTVIIVLMPADIIRIEQEITINRKVKTSGGAVNVFKHRFYHVAKHINYDYFGIVSVWIVCFQCNHTTIIAPVTFRNKTSVRRRVHKFKAAAVFINSVKFSKTRV